MAGTPVAALIRSAVTISVDSSEAATVGRVLVGAADVDGGGSGVSLLALVSTAAVMPAAARTVTAAPAPRTVARLPRRAAAPPADGERGTVLAECRSPLDGIAGWVV